MTYFCLCAVLLKNQLLLSISLLLTENTTYEAIFLGMFGLYGPALGGNS